MSSGAEGATLDNAIQSGFRVIARGSVDSTNDEAKRLARAGMLDRAVVWAKRQETGRGRRGRSWSSPEGNLYCSILLRPSCTIADAAQLSFVAGLALDDALAAVIPEGVERRLKWPNDLLLNGRKVAGILLEAEATASGDLGFAVVGIGVNVLHHPANTDRPATSLGAIGAVCDVELVLIHLLRSFAAWCERWDLEGFSSIRAEWLSRTYQPGARVTVRLDGEKLEGAFAGLDAAGTLLLDMGGHAPRRVTAGDVFFGTAGC